jgi:RNA polymerase sigma factor (sigma-70 family)
MDVESESLGSSRSRHRESLAEKVEVLYRLHGSENRSLAYAMTGNLGIAEEIVQEAFVRLFATFQNRKEPEALERYLHATVINLARSHYRRKQIERSFLEKQKQLPNNEQFVELSTELDELWSEVRRLPIRQRAAVFLKFHLSLSEREIAETLKCSEGAAKSLVFRAMKTLKEHFKPYGEEQ